jgi:hypothetical protein
VTKSATDIKPGNVSRKLKKTTPKNIIAKISLILF